MKRTFTSIAASLLISAFGFSAQAQDFEVPEPIITVPIYGEAELFYGMFQVTWGYYELTDNAGDDPITCTVTLPDGTVKTVKGIISDANIEGTLVGTPPTTVNNSLSFSNFMEIDWDTSQIIQQYGTFKVNIKEGVVLVNGIPNPEAKLEFKITGSTEATYMPEAVMVSPTSPYLSYASSIQMYWPEQEIYFVDDNESVVLNADLDGQPVECSATIQTVEGGNEDGTGMFSMDVLYINFNDFISYENGTTLTVMIPEGIIANEDEEVNRAQTVELTLLPQIEGTLSPEDKATLESDDAFVTVSWEGISVQPIPGSHIIAREVISRNDTPVKVDYNEDASISLDLSDLEKGSYEIIIPEAFLIITTEKGAVQDSYAINSEIYATYTIIESESSGIENLNSENGVYEVFSIAGHHIITSSDLNTVKALQPGLYIINGTKTLIKK